MSGFEVDAVFVRRMENMSDMLNRIGLDPIAAGRRGGGVVLGSAVRVCESCAAADVCHDWLGRAAATLYKAPDFCPNADRFAQLLAEEAAEHRAARDHLDTGGFMEVARKCFALAEACSDPQIARVLEGMGRSYLEKAIRDRRRVFS